MAVIAGITAGNMRWMFACRDDTVVAAVASPDDLRVVNSKDWRKDVGVVAVLTNIAGLDMHQVLANGIDTVVAVNTLAGDVQMVEVGWQPADRCMTIIAGITACNVSWSFSACGDAIVA